MKLKNFLIKLLLTWIVISVPCTIIGIVYSIFGTNYSLCVLFYFPILSSIGFIIVYSSIEWLIKVLINIWRN